jgi:hypothetical protein
MKLAAVALVSLLGLSPAARADPCTASPPRGTVRQILLDRFDRDHDGRLEDGERRRAARALRRLARKLAHGERRGRKEAALRRQLVERYDLDGDGNVGPGEIPPDVARRLRRLDRNGDGWLDGADAAP